MLDLQARQVLVSMSVFDQTIGSTATALQQVSQVESGIMQQVVNQLSLLSLIEVAGGLNERRYTLHPLTHYFILSDIVKKWR